MKRLALFLDGTWNTVESRTNVSRLHGLVADRDGAVDQVAYYDQGVGTRFFDGLRGGILGYGLGDNIVEAYRWLLAHHETGDEIYLFGFSRGAYTARSLAGFIAKCGLLRRDASLDAATLFRRYQSSDRTRPIYTIDYEISQGRPVTDGERMLLASSRRVPIRLIAVWDTVGALGIPFGDIPGLSRRSFQFHHTRPSSIYEHVYQALAIDEHREAFQPTLWTRFVPKVPDAAPRREPKVEQRWFVGAHADVGGGNPTRLPELSLAWMVDKASSAGLKIDDFIPVEAAVTDRITDSFSTFMHGAYRLAKRDRRYTRTISTAREEKTLGWVETVRETIDASVFERFRRDPSYRPAGLLAWARSRGVDPASFSVAVDAGTAIPVG